MNVYIDASFLVSVYLKDRHSSKADELLRSRPRFLLTPFTRAEWAHAVTQHVFRGLLTQIAADDIRRDLTRDLDAGLWNEIPMPEKAFEHCLDLAWRHGPKVGMRALDSLHVACALELKAENLWTFDERQARLAKAVGLKTN